jgi:hypothetical protein
VEAIGDRAEQSPAAKQFLQQVAADPNLGRRERDEALDALRRTGDTSLAQVAQARLITEQGAVNESALRYLETALGDQVLGHVSQLWADPRVTNNREREELVQTIVNRVGLNNDANRMWQEITANPQMPDNLREEAISEMDDRGLNRRRPSERDRQLAAARMQLLEQVVPSLQDPELLERANSVYRRLSQVALPPSPR